MNIPPKNVEILSRAFSLLGKEWAVDGHGPRYDSWGVIAYALRSPVSPSRSRDGLYGPCDAELSIMGLRSRFPLDGVLPGDIVRFWSPRIVGAGQDGYQVAVVATLGDEPSHIITSLRGQGVTLRAPPSFWRYEAVYRHGEGQAAPETKRAPEHLTQAEMERMADMSPRAGGA